MVAPYVPKSEFLKAVVTDDLPLSGELGEGNLRQLIELMRDNDRSNRDWATFLLAQADVDTAVVRDALIYATKDEEEIVRAEAVLGLAKRDTSLALPLVREALRADSVAIPMLEAAALCAHPSLIADLRAWAEPSSNSYADQAAAEALSACEKSAAPGS